MDSSEFGYRNVVVHVDLSPSAPHGDEPAVEKEGLDDQRSHLIGLTNGGMNTKLHAVTHVEGCPIRFSRMKVGSVITPEQQPYWAVYQKQSGRCPDEAMTPTGSGMR